MPTPQAQGAPAQPEYVDDPTFSSDDTPLEPAAPRESHHPRTVELAEALGLTPQQIKSAQPEQLRDYVYREGMNAAKLAREYAMADARDRDRQSIRGQQTPAVPQAPAEPADLTLDGEADLHQGVVATLKRLDRENREYKAKFGELEQRERVREERGFQDTLDTAFDTLGPAYGKLFGEGGVEDLVKGSKEHRRRVAVLQASGLDFSKKPSARQIASAIKRTAADLFGEITTPTAAAPSNDLGLYGGDVAPAAKPSRLQDPRTGRFLSDREIAETQAVARDLEPWATPTAVPTHRQGAQEPHGIARAVQGVERMYSAMDRSQDSADLADEGDFPSRSVNPNFV